jgi:hypothetical protein
MIDEQTLQSKLLASAGFRHAFFTRRGGVSSGPYTSLNFSVTVGDEPAAVAENLGRAAAYLGIRVERLYFLWQVHGANCLVLEGNEARATIAETQGDGLVSRSPQAACAVRTADCAPILLADRESGAVAAAHAGWRGLVRGILGRAVRELRAQIGGDGALIAAIGPHISVRAFEVSADVAEQIVKSSPDPDVVELGRGPRPYVNLRRVARAQLMQLGLGADCIDDVGGCTVSEPELYFSFRRDGERSGRHLSAIVARDTPADLRL